MNDNNRLDRRKFVKIITAGGLAAAFSPLLPYISKGQTKPASGAPSTNIQDALKHPRIPESMPGKFPGRVIQSSAARAQRAGALAVLEKPFGGAEMLELVRSALG